MSAVEDPVAETDKELEDAALERAEAMADDGDERSFEERLKAAREEQGLDPETAQRRTLADLAAEEPEPEQEAEQYLLFGSAPRVNATVKTEGKVTSSHVKFKARQVDLPGQFQMGDTVELRVLARIDKLEFVSKHDGDGKVTETKRLHTATALTVEQWGDVAVEFSEVDGRDAAAELEALRARVAELEGQLANA